MTGIVEGSFFLYNGDGVPMTVVLDLLAGCGKTFYYRLLKKVQIQDARNSEE